MFTNLINLTKSTDSQRKKDYRYTIMKYYTISGISSDSEYIPLFAPLMPKGIYNKQIVHFGLPKENNYGNILINSYPKMYAHLKFNTATREFRTRSMEFSLLLLKGAIFEKISEDKAELIFTVAVKEDYMVEMFKNRDNLDYSKFSMFINDKFTTDAKYKTIYRKVYKELIVPHLDKGVDIIITRNIVDKCFNNKVKPPKFKSFTGLKEYLDAFNLQI